jgi:hypothetical protein
MMRQTLRRAPKIFRIVAMPLLIGAASLLSASSPAHAQPTADQVLTDVGLSPDDRQRVLNGEFVSADVGAVSDRDLAFALAFLVKASPDNLARTIVAGDLVSGDEQVKEFGVISPVGALGDFAKLDISNQAAQALTGAKAGESLNLSASEISAFAILRGDTTHSVQQQLYRMLLARYQAYRASGLGGIAPYDRGGTTTDLADDLRKASRATRHLAKYMPAAHAVLLNYPTATVPGMRESFYWLKYKIQGKETYVLAHMLAASEGAARLVVQRQYYASTGYDGEQAVAGFLPVQEGTVVVYGAHAFTDQVTGLGGSAKRGIGRRVMAEQMKKLFDAERARVSK